MRPDLRDSINKAVTAARELRAKAEALAVGGKPRNDPEYVEFNRQANAALDEADAWKEVAEIEERQAKLDAWTAAPDLSKSGPIVEYTRRSLENGDKTATPEYRHAFEHYVRNYAREDVDELSEFRTLSIVQDTNGGYTVPADYRAEIMARMPALSVILGLCSSIPTSRDLVRWPRLRPNTNSGLGSIYTSMFVGTMTGEVPATGTGNVEPVWGMFEIPVKRARSESRPSMDLAADTEFDLLSFLTKDGALNMALLRESQVIAGTGIGANCLGVTSMGAATATESKIATTDISGTTADHISNTTSDRGSADKIFTLVYAVPHQYRVLPDFTICVNSQTEKEIRLLVDAQNRYIWTPGFAAAPNDLLGYPLRISEFMPSVGTDGNVVMAVGAWGQVTTPVRTNVTPQILLERFADTDQIGLVLRQRFGVGLGNTDAFRLGIV